jgi:hypothetical protein
MERTSKNHCTLEDLEAEILPEEQAQRNRRITVTEQQAFQDHHRVIQQALESQFRRRITLLILVAVIGFLVLAVLVPDRYEAIREPVNMLLTATSGYLFGRSTNSNRSQKK